MKHGAVQLWHGNKTTIFGTEDTVLSATEKSAPSSEQHQVNGFFFYIPEIVRKELFHQVRLSMGIFSARF